jgi:hypothetical protein
MWRRRKRDREPKPERDDVLDAGVGDECEAYLAGRLAAYLHELGRPVPPVAWLNQVVHASPRELSLLAIVETTSTIQASPWRRAVSYLARSLLERARKTGHPIGHLQRELLVPLELELIDQPDSALLDPPDVIRLTLARLYELPELSA